MSELPPFAPPEGPPLPSRPVFRPVLDLVPPAGESTAETPAPRPRYGLALLLFLLTLFTTTTLGPVMYLMSRTDLVTGLAPNGFALISPQLVRAVWGNPALLRIGLTFSLTALIILLAHELGHYIACRRYGLACTLPYFLPVPMGFGTFGAFIRIYAPIRSKRELFDVGVAGPLAGFITLIPFLLYGVAHSHPVSLPDLPKMEGMVLFAPGRSLAIELVARFFHGPLGPNTYLDLHPMALGAWLGLFATALNLLPLGQLDGGHILYSALGRWQRWLAIPLWITLAGLGIYWPGWWLWCVIVFLIGLFHPPVRDERTPLDLKRRAIAVLALLIFVLSFMPAPLEVIALP
ncbi:MAG TPA: site-2 protease family protein [Thermoanaerobaculia bacterium]|nr:site-2 protease family protein [Thermoanaerobaculia bacterium]